MYGFLITAAVVFILYSSLKSIVALIRDKLSKGHKVFIKHCCREDMEYQIRRALLLYPGSEIYVNLPPKDAEAEIIFKNLKIKNKNIHRIE